MTLTERLSEYVRACFTGVWIQSFEQDDALRDIGGLCRMQGWPMAAWDVDRGLQLHGPAGTAAIDGATDPLAAVRALAGGVPDDACGVVVLRNFHRFLGSPEIIQAIDTQLSGGKQRRVTLVVLAPVVQIPAELERQFVVIEHEMPDRDQLLRIARGVATEPGDLPEDPDALGRILDAAAGMTRAEAENAFSLGLVRAEDERAAGRRQDSPAARVLPDVIWQLKMADLKKSGLLEMYRGGETFADLGGLENLKRFCLQALRSPSRRARPRGVLLLGVSGTGKSQFAKALGNEVGRPTIILDLGKLKGSLVGLTEERTRQALRILSAARPNIAFADEIEKGLAAVQGSGVSDSGVSAGQFGTLLSHMADHAGDSFFVFTANDIAKLPPEFTRAGRLNAIFFIDLPGAAERERIWQIHLRRFALDPDQPRPGDRDWSGAEIETCCETADLLGIGLVEAAQYIVPVSVTAGESVERLRTWAGGRCLAADRPGLYTRAGGVPKSGRSLGRRASEN